MKSIQLIGVMVALSLSACSGGSVVGGGGAATIKTATTASVPKNAATVVEFTDIDTNQGLIGGDVKITKASSEADVVEYVLYWGTDATTKQSDTPIAKVIVTGSDLTYTIANDTAIPSRPPAAGTTAARPSSYLLVFTSNNAGDMATGVSVAINDQTPAAGIVKITASPTFIPAAGSYNSAQRVTISTITSGATIYYTVDGSTPTTASSVYSSVVAVTTSQTVKAFAANANYTNSGVESAAYTINGAVSTPTFGVAAGSYGPAQSVTLSSATTGAELYYTTDGTTPTTSSSIYSSAIDVALTRTIKAIATKVNFTNSGVGIAAYTINGAVATPTFSVAAGSYGPTQTVAISITTTGATIYYTTNGSIPTTASAVYSTPISVSTSQTIKTYAVKTSYSDSAMSTAAYTINGFVATPTFSVAAGTFASAQTVDISTTTVEATIYYTTNGSTPTTASSVYSTPISISTSQTIKAYAVKTSYSNSAIASAAYTINGAVVNPTFSVSTGTYSNDQYVTLSSTTPGAAIYYTVDGSNPTTAGALYSGAIAISSTSSLKAFAIKSGYVDSGISSQTYTMVASTPTTNLSAGAYYVTTHTATLSSSTSSAVAHWTTDGSTPTCASATGAVFVTSAMTVKAIACKTGYTSSVIASFTYIMNTITPVATEAFPDTSYYPTVSWTPNVKYSVTVADTIGLYSNTSGSAIMTPGGATAGTNVFAANTVSTLGQTNAVYAKNSNESSYINMGSYTTKMPPSFSLAGVNGSVTALAVDSLSTGCTVSACIYVAGNFTMAGKILAKNIAKFTTSDGSWSALGSGLSGQVTAIAMGSANNLYVSGLFSTAGVTSANYLAKWNSATGTWSSVGTGTVSSLGTGIDNNINSIAFDSDRNILYAGGRFSSIGGISASGIAKWDGTAWTSIGGVYGRGYYVNSIKLDLSGNLYVGGSFMGIGGVTSEGIGKWNVSTSSWSGFGSGLGGSTYGGEVTAIALGASGTLYAGGTFTNAGGSGNIAKWTGSNWQYLGSGVAGSGGYYYNFYPVVLALDDAGSLYAGGAFTVAGNVTANYMAKWNGTTWSTLGTGMNNRVDAMIFDSSGKLYAGGWFSAAGGLTVKGIAVWDGSNWSDIVSGTLSGVRSVASDASGNTYVAGSFSNVSGVNNTNNIAKWNDSSWAPLGTGVNGDIGTIFFDSHSNNIFAGGSFTSAGGASANNIATWNGSAWSTLGSGMNGRVSAIAISSAGILYAGGAFTTAGGASANYVAQWDASANAGSGAWTALGTGANGAVSALVVDSVGNLYAGGVFSSAGGVANTSHIAKWDGTQWIALGSGVNNSVSSLALDAAGSLYAGGAFTMAGAMTANYIAKWSSSAWSTLGVGLNNNLGAIVARGGNVYVAGAFTSAGGLSASRLALWNGSNWSALGSGVDSLVTTLSLDSANNLLVGGYFITANTKFRPYLVKWMTLFNDFF